MLLGTSDDIKIEAIANIERQSAAYFAELLSQDTSTTELSTVLQVSVSVHEGRFEKDLSAVLLESTVDLVYRSNGGSPVQLDNLLTDLVEAADDDSSSSFEPNGNTIISLDFKGMEDDSKIVYVEDTVDEGRSSSEAGLIAATSILSVILVVVSSVLLYITGGWDAFQRAVTNCLFEEIDVEGDNDNYLAHSKSTFQVQSTEGDEEEDEESSIATGMQTNPSGMLGGVAHTQGLGIVTPGQNPRQVYGAYTPDGDDTQMTSSSNHLGIQSMRKMPQNEDSNGGLTHMIMQRLYKTNNNAK